MNQAPVTGESMLVEKAVGDTVFAGSINGEGALEVRAQPRDLIPALLSLHLHLLPWIALLGLAWRGLVHQHTEGLEALLAQRKAFLRDDSLLAVAAGVTIYVAASNLIPESQRAEGWFVNPDTVVAVPPGEPHFSKIARSSVIVAFRCANAVTGAGSE